MNTIQRLTVGTAATIRDAMAAMETTGAEVSLVVDESNKCVGIVTDGDVRRCLLRGAHLEDNIGACLNRNFHSVGPMVGRAEALDLMLARGLAQVPVVDEAGCLAGLHLLREMVARETRPNQALIMAGGQGLRLRPLTEHIPKPMIRVAGRPILERLVLHLVGSGIRRIHLAVNHLSDQIQDHFGDGSHFGCQIDYLRESTPLGSAGALTLLPAPPENPLLVLNGDLVTQIDVASLLAFHETGRYRATVAARHYSITVPFGVIGRAADGQMSSFREKPTENFLINAGIYVLSTDCWELFGRGQALTMPDVLIRCADAGSPPGVFLLDGDWHDVGRQEDLQRARGEIAP